jgi:hypothetical protein
VAARVWDARTRPRLPGQSLLAEMLPRSRRSRANDLAFYRKAPTQSQPPDRAIDRRLLGF